MAIKRRVTSPVGRVVLANLYAVAMLLVYLVGFRARPSAIPLLLIALGLPLVFRLVPRNYFYGLRVPSTLWTTEERWYRQNVISGVAMVLIGVVWLVVKALR